MADRGRRHRARRTLGTFAASACLLLPPTALSGQVRPNVYEVAPEQVAQQAARGFVEVTGTGTATVAPDRAAVALAMETRAPTANEASTANAAAMDRVIATLRSGRFEGLEVSTHGYALRPEYASGNPGRTREVVAYVVQNNIRATIADVSAVGRLIDATIAAGANRVESVSFYASDTEDARAAALADAVSHARRQAEVIAAGLGEPLGPPLEVRGGAERMPTPVLAARTFAMEAQAAPTPIEAGSQIVTASVTIRFALGGGSDE